MRKEKAEPQTEAAQLPVQTEGEKVEKAKKLEKREKEPCPGCEGVA